MKFIHQLFSKLGFSFGGYKACLKYDCKRYCGMYGSEAELFMGAKIAEAYAKGMKGERP